MNLKDPLYFHDFCAEAGVWQCHWCGEYALAEVLRQVQVDEVWIMACIACLEVYE